jgi:hypothetical protein
MDENEPLEWHERLFLQVVVSWMALAIPLFWLFPLWFPLFVLVFCPSAAKD